MSETPHKSAKNEWLQAAALVAIVLVVFFVSRALYTYMTAVQNGATETAAIQEGWQTYEKLYFSIALPEAIKETHVEKSEIDESMSDYAVYTAHNRNHLIAIEEMTFIPGESPTDIDALLVDRGGLVENAPGVEISFRSADNFKGLPARRYDFYLPESEQFTRALLVFKKGEKGLPDRYYTLSELSITDDFDDADFDSLLSSFELK